jgi:L-ascorbate metabolism protein UlaG (beta-lactamase superfamily)
MNESKRESINGIEWLGHASFRFTLEDGRIVYTDPFRLDKGQKKADIILISHSHSDHLSPDDVRSITKVSTQIIGPSDCRIGDYFTSIESGQAYNADGIRIEAVPAYNIGKKFHPKNNGWVGYIIAADHRRIYFAGDTDVIPEMANINADIALLPVGGRIPPQP